MELGKNQVLAQEKIPQGRSYQNLTVDKYLPTKNRYV